MPLGSDFIRGFGTGMQNVLTGTSPQQRQAEQQRLMLQQMKGNQEMDTMRRQAMAQDVTRGIQMLKAGDTVGFVNLFANRLKNIQQLGGDPNQTQKIIQMVQGGNAKGAKQALAQLHAGFVMEGLANPINEAEAKAVGRMKALMSGTPVKEKEYTKELRGELRKGMTETYNAAKTLKTNYNKIVNLADEVKKGNRTAVAQMGVALVKLGDPTSVVKDEELKQAFAAQDPRAAVMDVLRNGGVNDQTIQAFQMAIDPLNPKAINMENILTTADAMLGSNRGALLDSFKSLSNRGLQNLTAGGYKSVFDDDRRDYIMGIKDLGKGRKKSNPSPKPTPGGLSEKAKQLESQGWIRGSYEGKTGYMSPDKTQFVEVK